MLAVVGCALLGYWQFERSQEPSREAITNPVEDLANASALGDMLAPGEYMPQTLANEAVTATGEYDPGSQLLSPALSPEGEEGYNVIVPLVTDEGVAVIVNRGWIPEATTAEDLDTLPSGEVTVDGWLMMPQDQASEGYSAMSVPEGQIERISPALLVNEWPYQLYGGYVALSEHSPGGAGSTPGLSEMPPPPPETKITWNFRNLSYAAQWLVFAVAAIAFWVSLMRRELADHRSEGAGPGSGAPGSASADEPQRSAVGVEAD
ncbi:Cytochrome oxidase assembly protein ShyY1 [Marinactinospora thermotolerans DSM 45154]|uniref:SURF1-like protein n=1 Tax=Marinactinospora thermotolerans DSM 45154 TaxID=1122192 RepID=A0A1T4T1C7_9ACTN|nr:Cytochrome oxidase assembly protein ShyY1 [Marinactinospora thermotolerans DSM 45154]